MNYSTPIKDRLAFRGEPFHTDELIILNKKCRVAKYEPYLASDGDGAIIIIFDFGTHINNNRYFAVEKSSYYKFFLIGFSLFSDGGSALTNISSLSNDDLSTAVSVLKEYIETIESGKVWHVRT